MPALALATVAADLLLYLQDVAVDVGRISH